MAIYSLDYCDQPSVKAICFNTNTSLLLTDFLGKTVGYVTANGNVVCVTSFSETEKQFAIKDDRQTARHFCNHLEMLEKTMVELGDKLLGLENKVAKNSMAVEHMDQITHTHNQIEAILNLLKQIKKYMA